MSHAAEISVYDRMCWPEAELEQALRGRRAPARARGLPGRRDEYSMLAALAASRRRPPGAGAATRRA